MSTGVAWKCPFCKRHATITASDYSSDHVGLASGGKEGSQALRAVLTTCPNPECRKFQLQAWLYKAKVNPLGRVERVIGESTRYWSLVPDSDAAIFPDYVPQQIRDDYVEACRIVALSPKAAAALARRCLQGMIRDVWKVKKNNLAKAIEAIKKQVKPDAWTAIDGVRTVGNIGAHMEKDVNLIVPVDPGEAEALLRLIEALVEDWYVEPHERQALYAKVTAVAKSKAAARKPGGAQAQPTAPDVQVPPPPPLTPPAAATTAPEDPDPLANIPGK